MLQGDIDDRRWHWHHRGMQAAMAAPLAMLACPGRPLTIGARACYPNVVGMGSPLAVHIMQARFMSWAFIVGPMCRMFACLELIRGLHGPALTVAHIVMKRWQPDGCQGDWTYGRGACPTEPLSHWTVFVTPNSIVRGRAVLSSHWGTADTYGVACWVPHTYHEFCQA